MREGRACLARGIMRYVCVQLYESIRSMSRLHIEATLMTLHVPKNNCASSCHSSSADVACTCCVSTWKADTRALIATPCTCIGASASTICLHLNLWITLAPSLSCPWRVRQNPKCLLVVHYLGQPAPGQVEWKTLTQVMQKPLFLPLCNIVIQRVGSHLGSGLNKDGDSRKTAPFPTVALLGTGHKGPLCSGGKDGLWGSAYPHIVSERYTESCNVRR